MERGFEELGAGFSTLAKIGVVPRDADPMGNNIAWRDVPLTQKKTIALLPPISDLRLASTTTLNYVTGSGD